MLLRAEALADRGTGVARVRTGTMSGPCPACARSPSVGHTLRARSASVAEPGTCTVVGIAGDDPASLPPEAVRAIVSARLVVGSRRHLSLVEHLGVPGAAAEAVDDADADAACRTAAAAVREGLPVCVLTYGDPGFFGIVRALLRVVDRRHLRVVPAPSLVSLAFARLGLPWDDAVVVPAGGRTLDDIVRALRLARKAAVLTTTALPPERIGRALRRASSTVDFAAVCSNLGTAEERVTVVTLEALATGTFDPSSIVVLVGPAGRPLAGWGGPGNDGAPLAWGLPDDAFELGRGVVPDAEVRAVVLGKLRLPPTGVLWEVGAGGGTVAVEAAAISPGLTVVAVEERADQAALLTSSAARRGATVTVVHGRAPEACEALPDPERVFIGTGGVVALDHVLERLRPGGVVVAALGDVAGAARAAERLGNLVQLGLGRGRRRADGTWGLVAVDPVFLVWGPS